MAAQIARCIGSNSSDTISDEICEQLVHFYVSRAETLCQGKADDGMPDAHMTLSTSEGAQASELGEPTVVCLDDVALREAYESEIESDIESDIESMQAAEHAPEHVPEVLVECECPFDNSLIPELSDLSYQRTMLGPEDFVDLTGLKPPFKDHGVLNLQGGYFSISDLDLHTSEAN